MIVNRRSFLRRSIHAALGGVALGSALGQLRLVHAATGATAGAPFADYKALVCVYLDGGNDSVNTLVPHDAAHHAIYNASRPALAVLRADAAANALLPQAAGGGLPGGPSDGASYGLHPAMPQLRSLFNQQRAAVVANVGPLLGPLTRAQYQANPALAPPQLFSHSDQTNFWHTSRPDDPNADGWGGRIADLLHAGNPNPDLSMTMSFGGQSLFQRGSLVDQYVMQACYGNSCGVDGIEYLDDYQNDLGAATFRSLHAAGAQSHMFERAYAAATRRSIATYERLDEVLGTLPTWTTPFPDTSLGGQLRQVANLISKRGAGPDGLDMRRQIFFVRIDGFDTHGDQLERHAELLADLSAGLDAFYQATEQLGVASQVTTFTASDFGRSISTNGDGTDHGWGGHHFVLGGAVHGGRFFGTMPSLLQDGNPDDAGYGQIIPTTGVDQYAATLARWFGVAPGELATLFPRLGEYATDNLGFLAA
jgi:uncharacterized protein (DUF1501 family)